MTCKCQKHPECPSVNEWIKKLQYIYTAAERKTLLEYDAAERKKELLPFREHAWNWRVLC